MAWLTNTISVIALVVAIAAAYFGLRRASSAEDANRITTSNPWVALLMSFISDELKSVQADRELFQRICKVHFENKQQKESRLRELMELRDASSKRLYFLVELAPAAAPLIGLQAAVTAVDDSYFADANGELELPAQNADKLFQLYQKPAIKYAQAIRDFAKNSANFR